PRFADVRARRMVGEDSTKLSRDLRRPSHQAAVESDDVPILIEEAGKCSGAALVPAGQELLVERMDGRDVRGLLGRSRTSLSGPGVGLPWDMGLPDGPLGLSRGRCAWRLRRSPRRSTRTARSTAPATPRPARRPART